jgi:hypothetical protein
MKGLRFKKTGSEIKSAVSARIGRVKERLARRDQALDAFLGDRTMVRSLLIRSLGGRTRFRSSADAAALHSEAEISSEQMEEIRQLCERIFTLEQELRRLQLIIRHLADDEICELTFDQLTAYGFEP